MERGLVGCTDIDDLMQTHNDRHLTDCTVQSKSVAWERRGRLPTAAKNIRDLFALYMEEYPLRYN